MKLTGKTKAAFRDYLEKMAFENKAVSYGYDIFYQLPESMQWGVYVDFFDNVGILMYAERYWDLNRLEWSEDYYYCVASDDEKHSEDGYEDTFLKCRQAAIEKANEIYNSKTTLVTPADND